eukprot:255819-Prymnesium_polylepis.1
MAMEAVGAAVEEARVKVVMADKVAVAMAGAEAEVAVATETVEAAMAVVGWSQGQRQKRARSATSAWQSARVSLDTGAAIAD